MKLDDLIQKLESREDLAEFVSALVVDLEENPEDWENRSLGEFLRSLSAWIADMDGYNLNYNLDVPKDPTWRGIAEMLIAARVYE